MLLIIDGDTPVYRAAGAAQHKNKETGDMEYDPEWVAYANVKKLFTSIRSRLGMDLEYKIYLTETNVITCFRTALYTEYKANRKRQDRPRYYKEVRQYLINAWGAEVVKTIEADDIVAIKQCEYWYNTFPEQFEFVVEDIKQY